jgi:hypothetical protein
VTTTFLEPAHLEVDVRMLWQGAHRTGRYQIEVKDPSTGELLAMRSRPFHEGLSAHETLEQAFEWARGALDVLMQPF